MNSYNLFIKYYCLFISNSNTFLLESDSIECYHMVPSRIVYTHPLHSNGAKFHHWALYNSTCFFCPVQIFSNTPLRFRIFLQTKPPSTKYIPYWCGISSFCVKYWPPNCKVLKVFVVMSKISASGHLSSAI